MRIVSILWPKSASGDYDNSKIAYWVFVFLSVMSFVRSCIHTFAPDGGAGSIATLDLSQGAENIIFAFGLWGVSQILYAVIQLAVAFRYKTLIPFMYVILFFETAGRMWVGHTKPPIYAQMPPGGISNYILLPLTALMLFLLFWPRKNFE
jgi:hypothetical protein